MLLAHFHTLGFRVSNFPPVTLTKAFAAGFNIVEKPFQIINGKSLQIENGINADFGRSIAFYEPPRGANPSIYIGFPNGLFPNTTKKGGGILKCTIKKPNESDGEQKCANFKLQSSRHKNDASYEDEGQQLGASMSISKSGKLVACAPRFQIKLKCRKDKATGQTCGKKLRNFSTREKQVFEEYVAIPGRCYAKDLTRETAAVEWKPCSEALLGNGMGAKDGFCQAGSGSVSFSGDERLVFIGSPGRNYGQGQVSHHAYDQRLANRMLSTPSFENYELLRKLRSNKRYSKVSVTAFFYLAMV